MGSVIYKVSFSHNECKQQFCIQKIEMSLLFSYNANGDKFISSEEYIHEVFQHLRAILTRRKFKNCYCLHYKSYHRPDTTAKVFNRITTKSKDLLIRGQLFGKF